MGKCHECGKVFEYGLCPECFVGLFEKNFNDVKAEVQGQYEALRTQLPRGKGLMPTLPIVLN
jgi:uncharacterized protein (DUF2225 family)